MVNENVTWGYVTAPFGPAIPTTHGGRRDVAKMTRRQKRLAAHVHELEGMAGAGRPTGHAAVHQDAVAARHPRHGGVGAADVAAEAVLVDGGR